VAEILLVSKPIAPPWNDGSKNLVRDLARGLTRHRPVVLTRRGVDPELGQSRLQRIFGASSGGFALAPSDRARVLARLMLGARCDAWHFFFAPNPAASSAARIALRVRRGPPTVQTVCSAPRPGVDLERVLFADRVVVLSRKTEARLLDAGIARERVRRIPPAVDMPVLPEDAARRDARARLGLPAQRPLVVYPGDAEFSGGARLAIEAHAQLRDAGEPLLIMACRAKTEGARAAEQSLRARAAALGCADSIRWLGETPAILDLLAAADVVSLPAEDLYAKLDLPLVLLEAMGLGRAVIVAQGSAAAELGEGDAARVVEPETEALVAATRTLLQREDERHALGARARASVQDRFAPAAMAAAHEALYDELLA
jgi:phosphatidylinositol alpha-1,6-mannosyltransferase